MLSQKKLNTYGVESPCNHLPRVGSFLANPGLSKEQHLRRCRLRIIIMRSSFVENLPQYLWHCVAKAFIILDIFIGNGA